MKYRLAGDTWGKEELEAILKVASKEILNIPSKSWEPNDCPLCKKNLPMEKKQDIYLSQEDYQILETDFFQKCDQEVKLLDGGHGIQCMPYSFCR